MLQTKTLNSLISLWLAAVAIFLLAVLVGAVMSQPAEAQLPGPGERCPGKYELDRQSGKCLYELKDGEDKCPPGGKKLNRGSSICEAPSADTNPDGSGGGGSDNNKNNNDNNKDDGNKKPRDETGDVTLKRENLSGAEVCGKDSGPSKKGVPIGIKVNCSGDQNPIFAYAKALIRFLAVGVGLVIVGAIIFGGIAYASARGDQAQTKKAIEIITNAGIALVIFLLMTALLNFMIPGGIL